MIKKGFIFLFFILFFLINAPFVFGQTCPPCDPNSFLCNPLCSSNILGVIQGITTYIATIVGSLSILVFLWAGILYITSAGNQSQLEKARKALVYGVIGLAIAMSGAAIVTTVVGIIGGP